jgi:hypothetical protein
LASFKEETKKVTISVHNNEGGEIKSIEKMQSNWGQEIEPGLNSLSRDTDWVKFEVSSKFLGPDINDLLHIGNIERLIPFLSRFLVFHTDNPLAHTHLSKCHVTADVPLAHPFTSSSHRYPQAPYVQSLLFITNPRYRKDNYKDQSVWFRRGLADLKDTCPYIIYNRFSKLQRSKTKSKFLLSLPNLSQVVAFHEYRLRFELKLLSTHFVRQFFNIPSFNLQDDPPFLLDVLQSPYNPLPFVFEDFIGDSFSTPVDSLFKADSWARYVKEKGQLFVIQESNSDMRILGLLIDSFGTGNRAQAKREIRHLTQSMLSSKAGIHPSTSHGLLSELKNSLRISTLGNPSQGVSIL